jgi:uncharacterized protein YbaR (Trm112 family)
MSCWDMLRSAISEVPDLVVELLITRTKQDRISHGGAKVGGTKERPIGMRPGPADTARLLENTLMYWVYAVAVDLRGTSYLNGNMDARDAALWLLRHPETIRRHHNAWDMVSHVQYAVDKARQAIDRPADKLYAGPCDGCGLALYQRQQAQEIVCRECRRHYRADERRAWLLEALRGHSATAAEIAAGVGELAGQPINRKRINQWHSRGRLAPTGTNSEGAPVFLIGDVMDLAVAASTRGVAP